MRKCPCLLFALSRSYICYYIICMAVTLMVIFLKHLWFIPNILKWQKRKIFTKLVPLQTSSRSSQQRCSLKKDVLKNLWNFTEKHLYWSLFLIKLQTFRPATLLGRDSNTGFLLVKFAKFLRASILKNICERLLLTKLNHNVFL